MAGAIASDVIWNGVVVPGKSGVVVPVLQLADGSFVGSVYGFGTGNSMVAFDASGNVKWTVPGYSPQIATADGGIIASAGSAFDPNSGTFLPGPVSTFDANGNATGQLPSLPIYSWKGAYQLGSVESVAVPSPTLASTFAAVFGANLSGNGTASIQHYIDVFWCGTGYGKMGSCSTVGGVDIPWKYTPNVLETNFSNAVDFSAAHPEWVDTIEGAALNELQKAFSKFPVTVERAAPHDTPWWQCIKHLELPGCNRVLKVYISGVWPGDGSTGETTGITPRSFVYYWISLQSSAGALNLNPPYPPQTTDDGKAFAQLLRAMGIGIANAAAHELGHQVAYSVNINMDCNRSGTCVGGNNHVFEADASSWNYTHVYPDIDWQNQNNSSVCAINQFFDKKYRDKTCTVDLTR